MSGIKGRDTKPELMLRRGLHASGFRYRLNVRDLPGRPDIVFPGRRAVLFAHGCFWHGHDCHLFVWPKTREEWWREKIERNRVVDRRAADALKSAGWRVGVVWECALKGKARRPVDAIIEVCAEWLRSDEMSFELRGF